MLMQFVKMNLLSSSKWITHFWKNTTKILLQKIKSFEEFVLFVWALLYAFLGGNEVLFHRMVEFIKKYCSRTEAPFIRRVAGFHLVYVQKPEDVQIVLNKFSCLGKSYLYRFLGDVLGEGIVTAPVHKWKPQRRITAQIFKPKILELFTRNVFNPNVDNLVSALRAHCDTQKDVDLWNSLILTSMNITGETTLGVDTNFENEQRLGFLEAICKVSELDFLRLCKVWLHSDVTFKFYAKIMGYSKYFESVYKFPTRVIKHKKELAVNEKHSENEEISFLNFLLRANENETTFSEKSIRDQTTTLLFAAMETTALTNCFTLLMLAMNPDIQDRVYAETIKIIREEDVLLGVEQIDQMQYLEQCIKETLRLFPPIPFIVRNAKESLILSDNFVIPARSQVAISPFMIHRNPKTFANPLRWNPDNFLPEMEQKRHKYAFLPFSGGPRGCLGNKYAMVTLKMILSKIIKNYRVTTEVKFEDIRLTMDSVLRSVNGFKVKLHSRN